MPDLIPSLQITQCNAAEAVYLYSEDWSGLLPNALEQNIHYEPPVFHALLQLQQQEGLQLLMFWFAGKLVGVWPLQANSSLPLPIKQMTSYYNSSHMMTCVPLIHKNYLPTVVGGLLNWLHSESKTGLLTLEEVTDKSQIWPSLLETAEEMGFLIEKFEEYRRPAMLNHESSYSEYLYSHTSGKRRNALKRKRKKIEAMGNWRIECCDLDSALNTGSPSYLSYTDDWQRLLTDMIHVESLSWKARQGSAIAVNPDLKRFVHALCAQAYQARRLYLIVAYLDDRPVASQLGLVESNEVMIYKLGFDDALKAHSPGLLLMHDIVSHIKQAKPEWSIDSCADPSVRLYGEAMSELRSVCMVRLSRPSLSARGVHETLMSARSTVHRLRDIRTRLSPKQETA